MSEAPVKFSRYYLLLLPMLAFLAAATSSEEGAPNVRDAADLERNRQLLHKWKADPEHYARLQRDLRVFWALPESKRRQIRQLDHAFHQLDAKTQKRLWKAAERYTTWLERLPQAERQQIEVAENSQERLQLIRLIRERQWIERLPRKVREDLDKLAPEERSAQIALLRKQERQQKLLWSRPIGAKQRQK
jgi:hypothetical protein